MTQSVRRAGRRALWRHPVQTLLAVVGVALGVAVVIGMDLANQSASTAMRQSMQAVAGRTTHQIFGGPEGLPESLYVKLRTRVGLWQAAPVVEGGVTVPAADNQPLTLVGIDPFTDDQVRGPIKAKREQGGGQEVFQDLVLKPGAVALPTEEARRLDVKAGDTFTVRVNGQARQLHVVAVAGDSNHDLSGYAFADISTAQDLLGQVGRLSRIDLILDSGDISRVRAALPPGVVLVPAAAQANAMQQMTAAFQTNLTALSLLALVIGLFLVFNTMSFMVVQRRRMIGILRAVGTTRRQILTQVLCDAALIGLLGTVLGMLLGLALGFGLVELVGRGTDASFQEAVTRFQIEPLSLAKGFLLGMVGSILAAAPPAFEAATVAPRAAMDRSELERRVHRGAQLAAGFGVAALVVGGVILVVSSGLVAAFVGLFAVIVGASLLAPMASARLTTEMARFTPRRPIARLVLRGVSASLSRTGVAIAALAVAISAVIGVAVMIDSFRGSFIVWLEQSLRADFYVTAVTQNSGAVDDALAQRIESLPGVAFITRSRHYRLIDADGEYTALWALDFERRGWQSFDIRAGDRGAAWRAFRSGAGVLISEPYAYRHDLKAGEALSLRTAGGERTFRIAGIFRDYGSPYGVVLMYRPVYQRLFGDNRLSGVGVYLAADSDRGAVHRRLEAAITGLAGVQVRDNQSIRQHSLAAFDQEFVITSVLRLLAALVAFVGVVGALMALQLDRTRELAVLRAIGFTRIQLGSLITAQSGLLGLAAGLFSIPLGLILAWLLVFVINHRAFGWSMEFTVSLAPLLEGVGLAVAAALIAALYPAWCAVRMLPSRGLREE